MPFLSIFVTHTRACAWSCFDGVGLLRLEERRTTAKRLTLQKWHNNNYQTLFLGRQRLMGRWIGRLLVWVMRDLQLARFLAFFVFDGCGVLQRRFLGIE